MNCVRENGIFVREIHLPDLADTFTVGLKVDIGKKSTSTKTKQLEN